MGCCANAISMETTLCKTGWPGYCGACYSRKWSRFSLLAVCILPVVMVIIWFTAPHEATFGCSDSGNVVCRESKSSICNECFCFRESSSFLSDTDRWCASYDEGTKVSGNLGNLFAFCGMIFIILAILLCGSFCVDHGYIEIWHYCDAGCCCRHPTETTTNNAKATPAETEMVNDNKEPVQQQEQAMERGDKVDEKTAN